MKIKGETITFKTLFSLDVKNHNSLIGGFMGFAHALISSLAMASAWVIVARKIEDPFIGLAIMVAVWFLSNLWWYRKETKNFTVSLFEPRSTPLVTLDTRMDFFNPLFWSSVVLAVYVLR